MKSMLHVSELYIYPVKSLGGISVSAARLTDRGFEHDRRWMLVDSSHHFMTQREHPRMALLQVAQTEQGLRIFHKENPAQAIGLPVPPVEAAMLPVQVWDDACSAQAVGGEADEWLSDMLSFRCRLLYMPNGSRRPVDPRYAMADDITSLSDGFPVLMIGQASLDDVNGRMARALPMNRFRPNIVFSGGLPYEEDEMAYFTIGGGDFYAVKPCARCVMTTIDQDTGLAAKEPLKTLAGYRSRNNKIYFGQNILYRGQGEVRVGDRLEVLRRQQPLFEQPGAGEMND